jgi:hypothetical protein
MRRLLPGPFPCIEELTPCEVGGGREEVARPSHREMACPSLQGRSTAGLIKRAKFLLFEKIYAFYTPGADFATRFLCLDLHNAQLCGTEAPMDAIYLIFGFVLAAATLGFLLLCDRLGPRS